MNLQEEKTLVEEQIHALDEFFDDFIETNESELQGLVNGNPLFEEYHTKYTQYEQLTDRKEELERLINNG